MDNKVIIIGSGIAGLSAAIYAARAGNSPLVIHGDEPGGQLTLTSEVANYPGFPESVGGSELIQKMTEQAKKFGSEFEYGIVNNVSKDNNNTFTIELQDEKSFNAKSVIVASGASARTLGVEGEDELMGYGLSTCATCDGAFFRDEEMVVVGGGDAALEEANYLTKFARKVYLIHRREEFRADNYLQNQLDENVEKGNVEVLKNTELIEIVGSKENGINHITLVQNDDGYPSEKIDDDDTEESTLDVNAVFYAIGHTPNSSYLSDTGVQIDNEGYVKVRGGLEYGSTETDVDGIFAAGDIVDYQYQQAATASGMGVKAALDVDEYLSKN